MDTVIKEKDVVLLSDRKSYSVEKAFEYRGKVYFCLIRKTDFDPQNHFVLFATEVVTEEAVLIKLVNDRDLIDKLSAKLKEIYEEKNEEFNGF